MLFERDNNVDLVMDSPMSIYCSGKLFMSQSRQHIKYSEQIFSTMT